MRDELGPKGAKHGAEGSAERRTSRRGEVGRREGGAWGGFQMHHAQDSKVRSGMEASSWLEGSASSK
jgi:hypothetical protein